MVAGLEMGSERYSLLPTRLPADSRVPKSSSVPAQLRVEASLGRSLLRTPRRVGSARASPSRIPVLKDSPSLPNNSAFPNAAPSQAKPKYEPFPPAPSPVARSGSL